MAKLAYYASRVPGKLTWYETDEGYRVYKDAAIARTGSQEYFGRELKKTEGYDPAWGLEDDQKYEVFRPAEEVTAAETIASFEGKSVLDLHPEEKVLVDALDEYDGVTKGHVQNVRVGTLLTDGEYAGETPLIADLWVKNPDLNLKIEGGIDQLSCGYRFFLIRDEAGRLVMTRIRGNHVAVVPKGRAGPEIAIGDAAPNVAETQITSERKKSMKLSDLRKTWLGKGFLSWATDAKPEEVADALENMEGADGAEEHPRGCRCDDCKPGAKDKKKGGKDAEEEKEKAAKDAEAKEEAEKKAAADKAAKDAEEEEKKKKEEDEKAAKDAAEVLPPEDRGKSEFSVGDALASLEALRPAVAKSRDKGAIDGFNALTEKMRKVRDGVKDGALEDPFVSLVSIGEGVVDAEPEPGMMSFFNGKSYDEGLKAYNAHLAAKASKGAK